MREGISAKTQVILDRAMDYVESVPYRVSLRWIFYRLLQDGTYSVKSDYGKLKDHLAKARKNLSGKWRPNTLEDTTRQPTGRRSGFYTSEKEAVENAVSIFVSLDHFAWQKRYTEIWIEAGAMAGQFEHHTKNIIVWPFRGDPSIDYKWRIAKNLERVSRDYEKPVIVLYFGDYDPAGMRIPECALSDIREWCAIDFEFIRCGLSLEQAEAYNLPVNPEKPDNFQWEALSDLQAGEIIKTAMGDFVSSEVMETVSDRAKTLQDRLLDRLDGLNLDIDMSL